MRNKFLRHGGALDMFFYKEEQHVTCKNKSRSEPGNAPRIGIGHREVVCQK